MYRNKCIFCLGIKAMKLNNVVGLHLVSKIHLAYLNAQYLGHLKNISFLILISISIIVIFSIVNY
jgi:hypothetical protein